MASMRWKWKRSLRKSANFEKAISVAERLRAWIDHGLAQFLKLGLLAG
mgnify:FL=1